MINFYSLIAKAGSKEGARASFEEMLAQLVRLTETAVRRVEANPGDWGIDVFVGQLNGTIRVWQSKFFINGVGESQQNEIRESFRSLTESARAQSFRVSAWTLCMPCSMDAKATRWWDNWKKRAETEHGIAVSLWDETELRGRLLRSEADALREAYLGLSQPVLIHPRQVPHQLPTDVSAFAGRTADLARLDGLLHSRIGNHGQVPGITVLSGIPGVGKSSLAVHWAHRVHHHFPDGQLYANLSGYHATEPPRDAADVLGDFLRAIGTASETLPEETDQRSALFRTRVADRRLLIILDDARSAAQVRPLLPGAEHCFVIITSRDRLSSLVAREGALRLDLDVLELSEAVDVLQRIIPGALLARAELVQLATLCARLPIALRIASERIVSGTNQDIQELIMSLSEAHRRLSVLATSDGDPTTALNSVFSWSYNSLPPELARLFRFLGLHVGPYFTAASAAALEGATSHETLPRLAALVGGNLLERHGLVSAFQFHDLIRLFAYQCAMRDESDASRLDALDRQFRWYLHATDLANRALSPHRTPIDLSGLQCHVDLPRFDGFNDALRWFDAERPNLVAVVRAAFGLQMHDLVWKMATAAWSYYDLRKYRVDWIETHELGLVSVQTLGDDRGECRVRDNLGIAYRESGRLLDAGECLEVALEKWRALGQVYGEAATLDNLGCVYLDAGSPDRALRRFKEALTLVRQIDDKWGEARVQNNIGRVHLSTGANALAAGCFRVALAISWELNDRVAAARCLTNLGLSLVAAGDPTSGASALVDALQTRRAIGDYHGEAKTLCSLAEASIALGLRGAARAHLKSALVIFLSLEDPEAADVRYRLDEI
jgi:tetratricopeptide (TPR) repeat protein